MLTIKRKDIVKLVKELVEEYSENLEAKEAAALVGTAVLADRFQLGTWTTSDCGCLVGTLYFDALPAKATNSQIKNKFGGTILDLGIEFDNRLRDFLVEDGQDPVHRSVVEIV